MLTTPVHSPFDLLTIGLAWLLFLFGALGVASLICLLAYSLVTSFYYVRDRRWRWR